MEEWYVLSIHLHARNEKAQLVENEKEVKEVQ